MSHADSHSDAPPAPKRRLGKLIAAATAIGLLAAGVHLYSARQAARAQFWSDVGERFSDGPMEPARLSEEPSAVDLKNDRCEETLREVMAQKALPGAPKLHENRMKILGRVKAEPVLFVDSPDYDDQKVRPRVLEMRQRLARSHPYTALKDMRRHFLDFHEDARQVLLKDGYLFAEDEEMAFAMATQIHPKHLFGHDRIWLQRGEKTLWGKRTTKGDYVYDGGALDGEPMRLMPWDRVGSGEPPSHVLHRDLRSLQYRLHFSQMQVRHVTATHVVANLRYGKWWVPTVLESDAAALAFVCDVASGTTRKEMTEIRKREERQKRVLQVVRDTILEQIDEKLPFDEPKREYGEQLDGKLRKNWRVAYDRRQRLFEFNIDKYAVYDEKGRPHVPQVCVDFLTDTFERSSGTWYAPRSEKPERRIGKLDFSKLHHPDLLRQVDGFIGFAKTHDEMFEVYTPPWNKRVKLGVFPVFLDYIQEYSHRFQPGDMVLIRGKTPWDPAKAHYHSFIVYENDPLTGAPLYVAGNPGRPVIRAWETEAQRTPLRKIVLRIRPRLEWLESIVTVDPEAELEPPYLGPGRG